MPPRPGLIELAKERRGQIIVPSGALLGLDAVTATAEGRIHSAAPDHAQAAAQPRGRASYPEQTAFPWKD
jgi:aspartate dehydrogenase